MKHFVRIVFFVLILSVAAEAVPRIRTRGLGHSRGGIYTQMHLYSLGKFGTAVDGVPFTIAGLGLTRVSRSVRVGGGGGAAFHLPGETVTEFALGYGGLAAEWSIDKWLSLRVLVGGGGYSVRSTASSLVDSSGGFIFVHPTLNIDTRLSRTMELVTSVGMFLPNVDGLTGLTVSLGLMWGRPF